MMIPLSAEETYDRQSVTVGQHVLLTVVTEHGDNGIFRELDDARGWQGEV